MLSRVSKEIHSSYSCLELSTSFHVEVIACLIPFQLLSIVISFPSSIRACKAWNLLFRHYVEPVSSLASRRKAVLIFMSVCSIVQCLCFSPATTRCWYEAISAPPFSSYFFLGSSSCFVNKEVTDLAFCNVVRWKPCSFVYAFAVQNRAMYTHIVKSVYVCQSLTFLVVPSVHVNPWCLHTRCCVPQPWRSGLPSE